MLYHHYELPVSWVSVLTSSYHISLSCQIFTCSPAVTISYSHLFSRSFLSPSFQLTIGCLLGLFLNICTSASPLGILPSSILTYMILFFLRALKPPQSSSIQCSKSQLFPFQFVSFFPVLSQSLVIIFKAINNPLPVS